MRRDAERANALLLDGYAPFQFTYEQLAGTPTTQQSSSPRSRRHSVFSVTTTTSDVVWS